MTFTAYLKCLCGGHFPGKIEHKATPAGNQYSIICFRCGKVARVWNQKTKWTEKS